MYVTFSRGQLYGRRPKSAGKTKREHSGRNYQWLFTLTRVEKIADFGTFWKLLVKNAKTFLTLKLDRAWHNNLSGQINQNLRFYIWSKMCQKTAENIFRQMEVCQIIIESNQSKSEIFHAVKDPASLRSNYPKFIFGHLNISLLKDLEAKLQKFWVRKRLSHYAF